MDYLLDMVKDGKLIVGSKLPSERELAEEIGIGRNSTREGLSILRGLGLIDSRHGSGNYVSKNCGKSIHDIISIMLALGNISKNNILEFRQVISTAVCHFNIQHGLDETEVREIKEILHQMKHADLEGFIRCDQQFHLRLVQATKNPLFVLIMEPVAEVYLELIHDIIGNTDTETRNELYEIHSKLFENILAKDEEACSLYMAKHYAFAEEQINVVFG